LISVNDTWKKRIKMKAWSAVVLGLLLGVQVNGLELTPDNWDSETAGKTTFIKFLAPW